MGFFPEKWTFFTESESTQLEPYEGCDTFEAFYQAYLRNLKMVVDAYINQCNRSEKEGWRFSPCPLHSSTISDPEVLLEARKHPQQHPDLVVRVTPTSTLSLKRCRMR